MRSLRYNETKPKLGRVWLGFLEIMARVLEFGAAKYDWDNWKKGQSREDIKDSLMRHTVSFINGENHDRESKIHHIGHIMVNLMFYWFFYGRDEKIFNCSKKKWFKHVAKIREKYRNNGS